MRKTTRLFYFLMVLLLSFVFIIPANADYAQLNEDGEFDPIFKSVPDNFYLCLDYYCITEFDDYEWMTEADVLDYFLRKVGYIPYCYEDEDFVTYIMLHGELKLEKRDFTEIGEPIYPDISKIPDEAYEVWSLDGFYSKDWYSFDEIFDTILPYVYDDYTFYVTKDLSLFKFFINIEFDNDSSYVYVPKKINIVSNNAGQLRNEDIMISSKDMAALVYELYRLSPKYDSPDYYIFIPGNVKLPETPDDTYDDDEEEPSEETVEEPVEEPTVEEVEEPSPVENEETFPADETPENTEEEAPTEGTAA